VALADAWVVEADRDLRGATEEYERLVDRMDGFGPGRAVGGPDLKRAGHPASESEGLGEADRGPIICRSHAVQYPVLVTVGTRLPLAQQTQPASSLGHVSMSQNPNTDPAAEIVVKSTQLRC
jgi:hypothetical protein